MTAASWRAGLRPASFRGVPFHVREADVGRGRRIAVHQYPGRDEPYAEDLGRAARTYTITAFVLPPDPLARAARLADALEAPGAGTLVLPWRTDAQVVCTGAAERYETQAGGLVVFTLQFTEAGERRYPARRVGDAAAVDRSASAAGAAAGAAFAAMFVARTGVTGDEAGRHWQHIITTIRDVVGPYARPAADGMAWGLRIQRASAAAADLIAAPDRIPAHLGALMGVPLAAGAGIAAFRRLIDYDADAPPIVGAGTAARQLTANRDAMVAVTRAIAIAAAARAIVTATYETYTDAISARDEWLAAADAATEAAASNPLPMIQLRSDVVRGIAAIAPGLPRVQSEILLQAQPAVVLAQRLYGDEPERVLDRADALVRMNRIRLPVLLPTGAAIEVIAP